MKRAKKRILKISTKTRLILLCTLACIPLFLIILLSNEYGKHRLRQQTIQYNHSTISLQLATIDTELDHISNYLASFLLEEGNYASLFEDSADVDTQIDIRSNFSKYLNTYSGCSSLFFYLPEQDIMILQTSNYDSYYERKEMTNYIRSLCIAKEYPQERVTRTGWYYTQQDEQNYLVEIMEYNNVYVGSWVIGKYIFSELKELEKDTNGTFVLSNQKNLQDALFKDMDVSEILDHSKDYVTIPVDSSNNFYRISLCIPEHYVLGAFSWFQYATFLMLGAIMIFFVLQLLAVWRQLVSPVVRMIHAMEAVQEGDFDTHLPIPDTGDEFARLTETFNYMISRIHDLKVQIYEEKLHQVYAELQYLTLQIKPHFFLNCLNLLYSLGLSGRSSLTAEFSATLMKYFRYLFKSSDTMVSVSQELEHVKNYLHIQQIRFQNELVTEFEIEKETEQMEIPVLSLHTFVENIFKHAYSDNRQMLIRITARKMSVEKDSWLCLCIEDNGKGFSPQILEELNTPCSSYDATKQNPFSEHDKHIGISNIKQRLSHIYNRDDLLKFENCSSGGARICLMLPQNCTTHTEVNP